MTEAALLVVAFVAGIAAGAVRVALMTDCEALAYLEDA